MQKKEGEKAMNFKDIFRNSFLEAFTKTEVATGEVIVILLCTCLVALYIFWVYRLLTRKTFYSKNFNISLAALSVITAIVILTVQSNIGRLSRTPWIWCSCSGPSAWALHAVRECWKSR